MMGGLRAGTPSQRRARSPVRRKGLSALHQRLGERDHNICEFLFEHRCLTTHQIQDLFFDSPRSTRQRLYELNEMQLVVRFRPHAARGQGTYPFHYVLGPMGAQLVAARRGLDLRELGYRRELEDQIAYSTRLPHLLDVNTFFSRLAWTCRRRHFGFEWHSETRTAKRWGSIVRPDGSGSIRFNGTQLSFFLEMDRGTERPWRLSEKLPRYSEAALLEECPGYLLFCFSNNEAEVSARRALAGCELTIATATLEDHVAHPLGRNWLSLDSISRRALTELSHD
jgi:hypothetical protein